MSENNDKSSGSDDKKCKSLRLSTLGFSLLVTIIVHVVCYFLKICVYWNMILVIATIACLVIQLVFSFLNKNKIFCYGLFGLALAVCILNFLSYFYGTSQVFVNMPIPDDAKIKDMPLENVVYIFVGGKDLEVKDDKAMTVDIKKVEEEMKKKLNEITEEFKKSDKKAPNRSEIKEFEQFIKDGMTKGDAEAIAKLIRGTRFSSMVKSGFVSIKNASISGAMKEHALDQQKFSELYKKKTKKEL